MAPYPPLPGFPLAAPSVKISIFICVKIKKYLDDICRIFSHESGALEIMEDIESRIAELFHERLGQFRQVVTDVDVKEIIVLMGEPRDYALEEFE